MADKPDPAERREGESAQTYLRRRLNQRARTRGGDAAAFERVQAEDRNPNSQPGPARQIPAV